MVNVYFNNLNLASIPYLALRHRKPHGRPKRNVVREKLARRSGTKLIRADYAEKEIFIEGEIAAPSRALMEISLDQFNGYLEQTNATLEFEQAGALRRYYATVENVVASDAKGGYLPFVIKFVADDPYGYAPSSTSFAAFSSITAATSTQALTVSGYYSAVPVFTITLTALTGGTAATVKLTNPADGKYISITRNWTAGDIISIDHKNRTVTVNGTAVNYQGAFTNWNFGAGTVKYDDTLTTRTVALAGSYQARTL